MSLIAVFFILYPLENKLGEWFNPTNFQHGSDRDDANNKGIEQILKGEYPYYVKTYLGNSISSFPGAFFISSIFYIIFKNSAYQNVFWLLFFYFFLTNYFNSRKTAMLLIVFSLTSPTIFYEYISGGDFLNVSILLGIISLTILKNLNDSKKLFYSFFLSFCLGFALSWKINFLVFLSVFFFVLYRKTCLKVSLIYLLFIVLGFVVVTFPFFFYDLKNFTPLSVSNKIKVSSEIPYIDVLIIGIAFFYSLTALMIKNKFTDNYLKKTIIVLSIPIVGTALLSTSTLSILNTLTYGMSYYSFFLLYLGKRLKSYNDKVLLQ